MARSRTRRPEQRAVVPGHDGVLSVAESRALENHLGGADAVNYRRYQFDLMAKHCGRSILEVGSGLGEFSAQFRDVDRLVVTDTDPICLQALRDRFAARPEVDVQTMDVDGTLRLDSPVDTVLAINVLEHIEDDVTALRGLGELLVDKGNIVLWVPGYMQLYGEFDRLVGHHRRYTPASLASVVESAGYNVKLLRPVNLLGAVAWWAAVRRGGTQHANPRLVRLYDRRIVPVTRTLEHRWTPPFGQTVLCVARRR
jgi:SAM-dependent methyltransferase